MKETKDKKLDVVEILILRWMCYLNIAVMVFDPRSIFRNTQ